MSFLRKHWKGITIGVLVVAAAVALVVAFPPVLLVPAITAVAAALTSPPAMAVYGFLGVVATVGAIFVATNFVSQLANRLFGKQSELRPVVKVEEAVSSERTVYSRRSGAVLGEVAMGTFGAEVNSAAEEVFDADSVSEEVVALELDDTDTVLDARTQFINNDEPMTSFGEDINFPPLFVPAAAVPTVDLDNDNDDDNWDTISSDIRV